MIHSRMTSDDYPEGYWERGEGSNYIDYSDEVAWPVIWNTMASYIKGAVREIACAKGYFVKHGYWLGYDVKGIDISQYAIDNAAPGVSGLIEQANAVDLPWSDDEAQVLFAFEFLEHVYEDEIDQVLSEIGRVTRSGSVLVFKIGLTDMADHIDDDHTHYTQHDREWWLERLSHTDWVWFPELEEALNQAIEPVQPTWKGRFFCYVK